MDETLDEIAERIERAGDRYRNAGDIERESESRAAAAAVRRSPSVEGARDIARAFESGLKLGFNGGHAPLLSSGRPPKVPWWKRWRRSGQTDDS